ncbi:hypothetical protein ACSV9I_00490 [Rhizobium sp. G187]|uniref:hypothetical protein n=1 Tax=Rhizobium sp. G187 TaxID=3451352 RepID=UPI003EE42EAF
MSLMVDPLCQSRHQVSQFPGAKGIAVCDGKPAHLEHRKERSPVQLFVDTSAGRAYRLFTIRSH